MQFESVESATIAAKLIFIEYDYCEVNLEQIPIGTIKQMPSCQVRVTALPEGFSTVCYCPSVLNVMLERCYKSYVDSAFFNCFGLQDNVVYEFHKALWKGTEIKKPRRPIISCDSMGGSGAVVTVMSLNTSAFMMCPSSAFASMICADLSVVFFYSLRVLNPQQLLLGLHL